MLRSSTSLPTQQPCHRPQLPFPGRNSISTSIRTRMVELAPDSCQLSTLPTEAQQLLQLQFRRLQRLHPSTRSPAPACSRQAAAGSQSWCKTT